MSETSNTCYLCGAANPTTRDHVPPRGLFVPPLPNDLITLPCCGQCGDMFKNDDEAVRAFFAVYEHRSAAADWIWKNKVVGSTFARSPKLRENIRNSMVHLPVRTADGVTMKPAVLFPEKRMTNWLVRITKGLLCHFYPQINRARLEFAATQLMPSQADVDFMYANMNFDVRGNGVFRFWHLVVVNEPNHPGIWCFVFYDGICFQVTHSADPRDLTTGF